LTYRVLDVHNCLAAWLDTERRDDVRKTVQEWLFLLAEQPKIGESIPNHSPLRVWGAIVPGTSVLVTWTLLDAPPFPRHLRCVAVLTVRTID
jgi:hypothetical protein